LISPYFAIHTFAAGHLPQLPLQPRGVLSTRGGRRIDLEQPKQALVQPGAAHSPQRSFEQASRTTAAGQQGRREVAPARQNHHDRPSGCCRKQWRRSVELTGSRCRPARTGSSHFTLWRITPPACVPDDGHTWLQRHPCGREYHPCDLRPSGRPPWAAQ